MSTSIDIDVDVHLKGEYFPPKTQQLESVDKAKIAICLHPWSVLGGNMNDPVLDLLLDPLQAKGYHVFRYNSRGVGGSSGWPSLTGFSEGKDLEDVVEWAIAYVQSRVGDNTEIGAVTLVGYSYGSLIASLFPPTRTSSRVKFETSYIILSYPLGPRSFLTFFRSSTYTSKLEDLIRDSHSDVLIVYSDQDEFTGVKRYERWVKELLELNKKKEEKGNEILEIGSTRESEPGEQNAGHQKGLEVCYRPGASHFWRGIHGIWLAETVGKWLA